MKGLESRAMGRMLPFRRVTRVQALALAWKTQKVLPIVMQATSHIHILARYFDKCNALFYTSTPEIPIILYTSSLKRYPFRAVPPRIVQYRKPVSLPPPAEPRGASPYSPVHGAPPSSPRGINFAAYEINIYALKLNSTVHF